MLHRTRDLLMRQRTQVINALRAHMAELGIVAARVASRLGLQRRAKDVTVPSLDEIAAEIEAEKAARTTSSEEITS
jgi:transposase